MRARLIPLLTLSIALCGAEARAQSDLSIVIPSTLSVPNYHRVGLGQREMLEGGAYVARTDDGGACWYNPAGLVRPENSVLNASANAYDWTTFTLEGRGQKTTGSAFNANASLVAGVLGSPIIASRNWRLGFANARPVNWQPGTADFAFERVDPSESERLSFVATADFSQMVTTAGAGWNARPGLRLGVALSGWWTSVTQSNVLHNALVDAAQVSALSRAYAVRGSVAHGTVSAGVQWDLVPGWTLGATVRTPGLRLLGSTLVRYDAQLAVGPDQGALAFRDEEARLDYRIPTHAAAGLAYSFARGAIEVDVRYHASTPEYAMISSDATGEVAVDSSGSAPATSTTALADIHHQAASVVGFAAGGHFNLSPAWVLHLGFFSDPSPVEDQERSFFRQIDIFGVTSGVELRGDRLSGSLGFGWNGGDSGPVRAGGLIGGEVANPSLKISTISITYAVSYAF